MVKHVIIINGRPENGKDTFTSYCINNLNTFDKTSIKISTITTINDVMKQLGWDGKTKDNFYRNTASYLKSVWNKMCDGSMRYIMEHIVKCNHDILFIDIREIPEIERTVKLCNIAGIRVTTVCIVRNTKIDVGNESDDNVDNYQYDYYVDNTDGVSKLNLISLEFVKNNILNESEGNQNAN